MKSNFFLISFFKITNPYSGASEVSSDFFKNIPNPKKLIQFSNHFKIKKNIISIQATNKIQKIFKLFQVANILVNITNKKKKNFIIFEGASWVGYTFIVYQLIKKKLKNSVFIYHAHNVEYLLRKQKENFIISLLTKYFENYIANKFDIFTSVSDLDKKDTKKLYKIKSQIFTNGINLNYDIKKINPIKLKYQYVLFSGSIQYLPNFDALKILVEQIMPKVIKKKPKLKLIVTGNDYIPFKKNFIINAGFVQKKKFYQYLKSASLFLNPMRIGFGSQLKIINSLVFGKTIISSKIGIRGINLNNKLKNVYISKNINDFSKLVIKNVNSKKYNYKVSNYYLKLFLMKNIVKNFFKKNKIT